MGIRMDIKRTDFYNELPEDKRRQFFNVSMNKFLPSIDNIYYGLIIEDDCDGNFRLKPFFNQLDEIKLECMESHKPYYFGNGLSVDLLSYDMYKYCITNPDLYDIFLINYLPNEQTPRIMVQIRAYGLWLYGAEKMLEDSYNSVLSIIEPLGLKIKRCRENRIDYCYHTNALQKPKKIFSDKNLKNQLRTTMDKYQQNGRVSYNDGETLLEKDYFALGNKTSNNVMARFYNKALEVVEKGYKGFFFELWRQSGLISEYDKYCFEKAFQEKSFYYLPKAKLEFYIEYGINERVKKEFSIALSDKYMSYKDYEDLANQYMPEVTTIMNIEYMTKRKFYYYSDEFIDNILETDKGRQDVPEPLTRLYKIIDNRRVFLKYLTSKTVSFVKGYDDDKKPIYAAWWDRLRNTKLDGLKIDIDLVRYYSGDLDEQLARKRFVNAVVTNAVYSGNVNGDFVEDVADVLSCLNDNDAVKIRINIYNANNKDILDEFYGAALKSYKDKKAWKYLKLKNRIKDEEAKKLAEKKKSFSRA